VTGGAGATGSAVCDVLSADGLLQLGFQAPERPFEGNDKKFFCRCKEVARRRYDLAELVRYQLRRLRACSVYEAADST
jgi:hypothetical protein